MSNFLRLIANKLRSHPETRAQSAQHMAPRCCKIWGVWLPLLLTYHESISAIELPWGSHLNGFVQQGFMWSDNNDFNGDSDDQINTQLTDLGLTLSHKVGSRFSFSGQVVSHQTGDIDNGEPFLDYAYASWHSFPADHQLVDIHAGRIIMQYGFYNEIRDIALSRPSIFAPYSVYYGRLRRSMTAHDGVGFRYQHFVGFDTIKIEGGAAIPQADEKVMQGVFPEEIFVGEANGQEAYFSRLSYESPLRSRYAASLMYLSWDYSGDFIAFPGVVAPVDGRLTSQSYGLSTQQHVQSVTFTAEAFQHNIHYHHLLPTEIKITIDAAYLQSQFPCFAVQCLAQVEYFKANNLEFLNVKETSDMGLGFNWSFHPQLALRLEGHRVKGQGWIASQTKIKHQVWHYIVSQIAWTF